MRGRTSSSGSGGSSDSEANRVLPADHIMFKLLGDFKEHTKVKIDIFIRDDKIRIEDFFEGSESKTFHQVLEGLTEVSKYFLNPIANALLQWRSSQHIERRLTNSPPTIIPDLCALILGQLSKHRLRSVSTRFSKEFQICLSSNTLKSKAFPILQGIRFFKVKITSTSKLKQSLEFLTSYLEFFKNQRIKGDLRRAISEILASILRPLTEEKFKPDISYTEWVNTIKELYDIILKKTKKTKDILTSYPLQSVLLCSSDKETFLKNYWGLMDNFIKIKDKTVRPYALESTQYLLECYLTKYSEQPEEVYERLHQLVSHIFPTGHTKKLTLSASDSLDIFVDIICVIANSRLDFAFEKIIFDLLRGGESKDLYITNPERMIVGLRAVMMIDQAGTNTLTPKMLSFSNSPGQSPTTSPIPDPVVSSNKVRAVRRQRYGTLNIKKVTEISLIEPYLKNLSIFLSQILLSLDSTFGTLLTSNQTKPINELLEKMRPPGPSCIELLKIGITVIPIAFPTKFTVPDLVIMLSKYLIHLDKGVCEKSSIVLTQLMASRPDIRPQIIYGLGRVALYLSDKQAHLINIVLEKQRELLEMWAKSKTSKPSLSNIVDENENEPKFKPDGDNPPDTSYVEAVAMVFLCSSNGRTRKICLSILESIRTVSDAFQQFKEDDEIEISTNIKDIIDENGNEYLYRHATGGNESKFKKQKTPQDFERILESEQKDDQLLWSACLSDIARAATELCPKSINKAIDLVLLRIKPIQPEESPKAQSITSEQEALWIWWRNYIIFSCITITVPDNTTIDLRKKQSTSDSQDSSPVSARELFNLIIPYLKSMDKFFSESALMALEKTNPVVLEVLFDVLKPFEHELHIVKKTKKKTDGIKSIIGIRRHCLETLKPGELVRREILKKSYIEFIQDILLFLNNQSELNPDYLWDNLHYIRFNLCALVHRIVQQLYIGGNEYLDRNLRRDLFRSLSKWAESEENLREEATSRRLAGFLQQEEKEISKRKEYHSRILEHATQLSGVASHAVSVILLGPFFIDTFKDPNGVIFQWINNMFLSKNKLRAVTRLALQNFIKGNQSHSELIYHFVNQCYSMSSSVANGYFLSLVELCQDQILKFSYSESILTNLIILNSGTKLSPVRFHALQLLSLIKASNTPLTENYVDTYYPSVVGTEITETYLDAQYQLSTKLSLENPSLCYEFFMDVVYRLEGVNQHQQSQMLRYVRPWIKQMHFPNLSSVNAVLLESVLQGLILISIKHSMNHSHFIEKIWRILGQNEDNVGVVVDFILGVVEKTRNHDLIPVFKRICIFLGRSAPQKLVNCLVSELTSTSAQAQSVMADYTETASGNTGNGLRPPQLSTTIQNHQTSDIYNTTASILIAFNNATQESFDRSKNYPLTRFQLPLIFLSEVSFEVGEEFRNHLPVLLQLIFLGLYYNHQPVHEHCRLLLLNLIKSLVIKKFQLQVALPPLPSSPSSDATTASSNAANNSIDIGIYEDAVQLVDFLLPSIYKAEDVSGGHANQQKESSKKEISNPKYVVMLSKRVANVLSNGSHDLKEHWGVAALNWATNSPNQRLAMRSYQILRGLEPTTTIDALTDVMQSLGKYIHNITPENAILISEIQETLQVMVRCIHPSKLILFPQIFWGTMAILHTDFENHYIGAIKLLSILLDIINFSDRAVQNVFLASMPKEWDNFHGLQPLIIKGLMSNNTAQVSIEFLSKLTLQPCDEIFHPEPIRFITNLTSLLPYLCVCICEPTLVSNQIADNLSILCENNGLNRMSTIFHNYSQQTYLKNLDGFLQDLSAPFCESVAKHSTLVFSLLFNILESGPSEYRYPILKILTLLVKGGVNPAETKTSRIADWYDTVTQFVNDHKIPNYIVSQAIRFIEITSGNSPSNLLTIDNASMKPSRNVLGNKKFSNKVDRGTLITANYLSKVLDTCARSSTSLGKFYSATQIFERFFSANDEIVTPHQKNFESNGEESDNEASSSPSGGGQPSSDIEMDTDTIHDFDPAEFHNFPHFQGFNDILEGLGDMSLNASHFDESTNTTSTDMSFSNSNSSILTSNSTSAGSNSNWMNTTVVKPSGGSSVPQSPHLNSTSTNHNTSTLSPYSTVVVNPNSSSPSSTISNTSGPTITSSTPNLPTTSTSGNTIAPTSPTSTPTNRKSLQSSSSPTLSRNIQYHTNSTLTTLSYNVTASKSWWNSCSEQIEFTSDKDLFDVFTAASQLVHQITVEYKTLFNQCLPLISSIASEVSALSVDVFEKPTFMQPYTDLQNTNSIVDKYKKQLESKPTLAKLFMEQREKAISQFTSTLNVYTEQRTSTNNTRAKLFENGISNDEMQIQIAETRFCFAICNLYQQLLQLWLSNVSLQELISTYVIHDLQTEKQRDEVKKELNKCKVLAVLFKEKESDLLSKNLLFHQQQHQQQQQQHQHQQHHSPTSPSVTSPILASISHPITTSPSSLSSPSLLDESHRISLPAERKRSSTSSNNTSKP
eukprot:gene661-818_t